MSNSQNLKIMYLAPYFPKECGIASYTKDLVSAYQSLNLSTDSIDITALNDEYENYNYPAEVKNILQYNNKTAYEKFAKMLNNSDYDLVHIQHEFGLYGGEDGDYIVDFVKILKKPYVLTLHTVLSNPNKKLKEITKFLVRNARIVIVMANEATRRLSNVYNLDTSNVHKISHGVPDIPVDGVEALKEKFGHKGKRIISTFGLINQNKGIEFVIEALPKIIQKFPNTVYLIIGRTHPTIVKKEGEKYRSFLEGLVDKYQIEKNVSFINRFLSQEELIDYLRATDLYITPYLEPQQISSGALAYALGAGKVCISTPYAYAKEVLSLGRGCIVPFRNSKEIEKTAEKLFVSNNLRHEIAQRSYAYGRKMIWPNIAKEHYSLFHQIFED